jgi:PKD repeat protein
MYDSTAKSYAIFKLNTGSHAWASTGVKTDSRSNTHADTLWDGSHLYIASHVFSNNPASGSPARLYRFSFNAATDTYSLDSGFPAQISNVKTETLVIAKDSTGKLWATWVEGSRVYVNRTVGGDQNWGTPFVVPGGGTAVTSDDISSIIAFGGDKVGIMWSNQSDSTFYFAVHQDGQSDTSWTVENAIHGPLVADDHINLKADAAGRVYAAVKTSNTSSNTAGVLLLVRPVSGPWQASTVWRVGDDFTKPLVLLDEEHGVVHVLGTSPCCTGGVVYEKTSPMGTISFAQGLGTVVINDASTRRLTDPTSSKQNVPVSNGFALLASNDGTQRYWFNTLTVSGAPAADFSASPTSGNSPLTVNFSDLSSNGPTSWSWDFGDGGSSTAQNPTHVYAAAGTYTVSLTAANGSGSNTATKVNYISVTTTPPAPVADFSASPTSGTPPLTVNFTDLSSNGPTSWSWDFGDGAASTAQNPTHVYAAAGTYTVSLTATNGSGSNTATKVNYISVTTTPPAPVADFSATPTSGSSPLTVNFSDLSSNGPTSWSWDFGDGGSSTAQNPTHVYASAGTYTVSLTATNGSGSNTATKVNYISVTTTPPAPVADFSASPTSGSAPLTVNFTDLSSNGPTTWSWAFGDGGTSTAQNPTHVYAAAGTYTVSLTATNGSGSNTATKVNYITVTGAGVPTFRSASSAANPTATTLPIPAPSGVVSGDVLIASVDVRGNPTITAPSGWNLIRLDLIQNSFRKATYYRVATASEPTSYTWAFSSSLAASGGILAFSGVSTSNPIDAHSGLASTGTNLITAPSVVTSVPNTMLVGLFAATGSLTITPPSGMTERFDITSNLGTYKVTSEGANALQATAGATGDRVARADVGLNPNIGQLIALRPAS